MQFNKKTFGRKQKSSSKKNDKKSKFLKISGKKAEYKFFTFLNFLLYNLLKGEILMKNFKRSFFTLLLANLAFFSCTNEFSIKTSSAYEESQINETSEVIKLASQRENPFASSSRQVTADVKENYVYFKIRTNVFENLAQIESILGDLQTIPLDYEVVEGGCENPENPENDEYTPWFYAMCP